MDIEEKEEDVRDSEEIYYESLYQATENVKDVDLKDRKSKILVENLISTII